MGFIFECSTCLLAFVACVVLAEDFNILHNDGSYEFAYDNPDSFHHSMANRRNFVRGEFGARNPKTGRKDVTTYTAGPRGYRPRGKLIVRKFDQNQNRGRPIGSRDDPHFDPNEDPSYSFGFKTRTHSRQEAANRLGDVTGKYTYLDDVGEKHDVEYIAGKNTGFHVKTPFPDSNPRGYGPLFFKGRGKPIPRGRTSIQRGLDGSYKFVSVGPDQRRTETSDASGNVRGSYTYLDDKGLQHSVHYIAGANIGYRVLKNVKGPHLPSVFPFSSSDIVPSDFYNYLDEGSRDVFDTAASSRPKPSGSGTGFDSAAGASGKPGTSPGFSSFGDDGSDDSGDLFGGTAGGGSSTSRPSVSTTIRPVEYDEDGSYKPEDGGDDDDSDDLFGDGVPSGAGTRPGGGGIRPGGAGIKPTGDDGGYRPSSGGSGTRPTGDDGSYRPSSGAVKPGVTSGSRPTGISGSRPTGTGGFRPPRPDLSDEDENDFSLFDESHPSSSIKPPVISIGVAGEGGVTKPGKHAIVTNLGDTTFTVPPGVSVHAHVQSIDLFPYESKVPSPSEQFNAETSNVDQKVEASEVRPSTTPMPSVKTSTDSAK